MTTIEGTGGGDAAGGAAGPDAHRPAVGRARRVTAAIDERLGLDAIR